jgi:hypothetical protein
MAVKKTEVTDVLYYLDNALTVGSHYAIDLFQMHCDFIEKENKLMGYDDTPLDEIEAQAYVEGLSGLYERLDDEAKARSHIMDMIRARKAEERPIPKPEPAPETPTKKKRGRPRKVAK